MLYAAGNLNIFQFSHIHMLLYVVIKKHVKCVAKRKHIAIAPTRLKFRPRNKSTQQRTRERMDASNNGSPEQKKAKNINHKPSIPRKDFVGFFCWELYQIYQISSFEAEITCCCNYNKPFFFFR